MSIATVQAAQDRIMTTATERAGLRASASPRSPARQRIADYVTLTKPRIISLLLVTTLVPMVVASGGWPGTWLVLATMTGGYLMAGAANALNMVIDRDIDAVMTRTRVRPVPSGRMSAAHATAYALTLAATSIALFLWAANALAATLALAGLLYYVLIYTSWLKRRTPQNIVVGGAAGAFPPLVGWAAVTGDLSLVALALFAVVFLWTPPHFWALALVKCRDYGSAGVPMAPVVWGDARTIRQMLAYTAALVPLTLLIALDPRVGMVYLVGAAILGGWFLRGVIRVRRAADRDVPAWALYKASLLYLALLFTVLAADTLVRPGGEGPAPLIAAEVDR
jgi:heme o synthase